MTKKYMYQVRMVYGIHRSGKDYETLSEVYLEESTDYRNVIKHLNNFYSMYPEAEPIDGEESFVGISFPLEDGTGRLDVILAYEPIDD